MAEETAVAKVVAEDSSRPADPVVVEDLLVEEISIDGMCGVY